MVLEWDILIEVVYLRIIESEVVEKMEMKWFWCIKYVELYFMKVDGKYLLDGDWLGYIEGYDFEFGFCVFGCMYFE